MDTIIQTGIWRRTLAEQGARAGGGEPAAGFRTRLRQAFVNFRERASLLAGEIPLDLKDLTVHDISHIDALWQVADKVVGEGYPFTPTEAFVLGGAFLLHDLGMALASYPSGISEFADDLGWRDTVARLFRLKHGHAPGPEELLSPDPEIHRAATEQALRLRHAEQAERLGTIGYQHTRRDAIYHLIEDEELRQNYGSLIGRIAYSHWWPAEALLVPFGSPIGASPGSPPDWTIDPLKLALIVRVADACHLDARRAPGFLRALRKPGRESQKHWRFQEYVQTPYVNNGRLVFSATRATPIEDADAWWLGYELLSLADREMHDADMILRDTGRSPFAVHAVAGANDPARLTRYMPTTGWTPISTTIRVGDVAGLVRNLGGKGLYGENPHVPLRELIQNARDAVVARRLKEGRDETWGEITVRLLGSDAGDEVEVRDTGVGMSDDLLGGPFLDFGASYWDSALMLREHAGLASRGFDPQGRFGLGFFSVFMWGDRIKVITRRPEDGLAATRVLEFREGLAGRSVLRHAEPGERLQDPGTVVHVWLDKRVTDHGGLLAPGPSGSFFMRYSRETGWTLKDLCAWLCPALDVDLVVEQDGKRERSVTVRDWQTMPAEGLLRRLLLDRGDIDAACGSDLFKAVAANVRHMSSEGGEILGRAALFIPLLLPDSDRQPSLPTGVVAAGSFRAFEHPSAAGLLLGLPELASRSAAQPIAFNCHYALSGWASQQAPLVANLTDNTEALARYALVIRLLGGDTGNLPIARGESAFLSFRDIATRRNLPGEIRLHADAWGVSNFVPQELSTDAIAVATGRMKSLERAPGPDPERRADHPRWTQYWMSLWGATIEAIAQAWGVPLQEVLEASEIASEGYDLFESGDGRQCARPKVDVIRNPRAIAST